MLQGMAVVLGLVSLLSLASVTVASSDHPRPTWSLKPTDSTQRFRGLSAVSGTLAWVSGTNGTVLKTSNGGETWVDVSPSLLPDNRSDFEFRDIEAWSVNSAVVLSIGTGNLSRVYKTRDGGKSWKQTFTNQEPTAFYDCMAFENSNHGLAMSDPVEGKFRLIETLDGGSTWTLVDPSGMPAALSGEAGFAASGTCLESAAGRWYLASGGANPGRVFRSDDAHPGHHWEVSNSTIAGGDGTGVFSVRFRDARHGIAVGGNYSEPTERVDIAAWSGDGGASWTKASTFPGGYRSGASWVPGRGRTAIAVGPTGSDLTLDGGRAWSGFDDGSFDAVQCPGKNTCWASGEKGRVARLGWS